MHRRRAKGVLVKSCKKTRRRALLAIGDVQEKVQVRNVEIGTAMEVLVLISHHGRGNL